MEVAEVCFVSLDLYIRQVDGGMDRREGMSERQRSRGPAEEIGRWTQSC